MAKTKLIFVGGFLGAGKTSLLYEVSRRLVSKGTNMALITNDQAPDLVDTSLLEHAGLDVSEVSGSCFCCDFKALRRAIDKAGANMKKDLILAEPVGSCTDLNATLIKPIQKLMNEDVSTGPLTVLADPGRVKHILNGDASGIHPSAAYIIRKQLEESEIIAITKSDIYPPEEILSLSGMLKLKYPECKIMTISSKSGEGIDDWIAYVLNNESSGNHVLDLDYDMYAEGEAVLGWLNCSVYLSGEAIDWDAFTHSFMNDLASRFDSMNLHVGHVKMMLERGDQYISANLTGKADTLNFRWSAGVSDNSVMILNARVEMSPGDLEKLVFEILNANASDKISVTVKRMNSISPGYPKPTYRFGR
ncbi:MAG: GTP-binding protein [Chloroflexota bacterium]